jgi:aromatic amino acid aminotransferase I
MATMSKALVSEKFTQGEAIDLSHHLSKVSRERAISPLKGLQKYFGKPGIISLAGGLPNPAYFPFDSISADTLIPPSFATSADSEKKGPFSWIWGLFSNRKDATSPITIPKYPKDPTDLNLATALQYGLSRGLPQLQQVVHEFTRTVYKPAYSNFTTMVHTGNTDGWMKAALTLCNPGEGILASAWTYPSAMATILPHGISPVPVSMDGQGMRSDSLRTTLAGWDEGARGMPRPHVLYIIPVGQNPTGATMLAQRKKEIYDICVEFDVIIVEDDPYYFLQEGPYTPPSERSRKKLVLDDEEYIASLAPSFLACVYSEVRTPPSLPDILSRFDYQGRVVRLDSFSKVSHNLHICQTDPASFDQ